VAKVSGVETWAKNLKDTMGVISQRGERGERDTGHKSSSKRSELLPQPGRELIERHTPISYVGRKVRSVFLREGLTAWKLARLKSYVGSIVSGFCRLCRYW